MDWNVTQEIFTPSPESFVPVLRPPAVLLMPRRDRLVHDIRSWDRIVALNLANPVDGDAFPGYADRPAMLGTVDKFAVYGWHPAPPRA